MISLIAYENAVSLFFKKSGIKSASDRGSLREMQAEANALCFGRSIVSVTTLQTSKGPNSIVLQADINDVKILTDLRLQLIRNQMTL